MEGVWGVLVRVQRGNGDREYGLSGAEERFIRLLKSWGPGQFHLPGLALVNVNVPDNGSVRQVDALMFTPSGPVAVEVKGFTRPQSGSLTVPLNGPWLVDGVPAAMHTLAGSNPGEQVKGGVYAAKAAFERAGAGGGAAFVTGLVVVMPHPRSELVRERDTRGAGHEIYVALGTPKDLRYFMHRHRENQPISWSTDGVLAACRELSLTTLAPDRAELVTEGFPETLPNSAPSSVPPPGAAPSPPIAAAPPSGPNVPSAVSHEPVRVPADTGPPTVSGPMQPAPLPPPAPPSVWTAPKVPREVPWKVIFVVTLFLLFFGIAGVVIVSQFFLSG